MKPYRLELDDEFHKLIKLTATQQGKSMKDFIEEAINEKIEKEKGEQHE